MSEKSEKSKASDRRVGLYEGLFLFPPSAGTELQATLDHVTELLDRAEAEIISLGKWEERRLAYEIRGSKRGLYVLAYFRVAPARLTGLERDCNLSEKLLRSMVTRAEHVPEEQIAAAEGRGTGGAEEGGRPPTPGEQPAGARARAEAG